MRHRAGVGRLPAVLDGKRRPGAEDVARRASAHAVSKAQYNRTNAVLGVMLVTSLLWLCEHEAP